MCLMQYICSLLGADSLIRKFIIQVLSNRNCHCDEHELEIHPVTAPLSMVCYLESCLDTDEEVIELDKEMLEKFFSGGFWRTSSRRNEL
ncbi:UNVERIFIED_CONTAM: hypothetical protein Sradi_6818200 [Sesamum radiatum]|uniref:Uncharacterized protein n=1 Tax=Sesamum radiatum TaxID=300843 RepID=A0AAW2JSN3_SESRA